MNDKFACVDKLIIECLQTAYGIMASTLTLLPIGADFNASVYRAQTQEETAYFVKLKGGHHHDMSLGIMELLQRVGIEQIIAPIKTINGQTTIHIEGYTLIVYPFITGKDGFARALSDSQWLTLGKALRQAHAVKLPLLVASTLRKETYSPKWRKAVRSLYTHVEGKGASISQTDDEYALKLLKFMKENKSTILRLVARAEQLAQEIQSQNSPPECVLCHSDIHGGNVLIDEKENLYIVDWDDPILAPKERDLMFIGGGVANVWNKADEEKLFYKGYGATNVNKMLLSYYRHERIVEDIALYGEELLLKTSKNEDRAEMYTHFLAMFRTYGVVDIAFETDKTLTKQSAE